MVQRASLLVHMVSVTVSKYLILRGATGGPQALAWRVSRDPRFEITCALAVITNLVYLGVQIDLTIRADFQRVRGVPYAEYDWIIGDAVFAIIFTIELLIRIVAFKTHLIWGHTRWWNLLDLVVVITACWEILADLLGFSSSASGTSILRAARAIRIIRLVRIGRHSALVQNCKVILYSLAASRTSFLSTVALLIVIMYTFGVMFMVGMENRLSSLSPDAHDNLEEHFGSMGATLWTLLATIIGGYDWAEIAKPLIALSPLNTLLFGLYVSCMYLGILNILNGVFVHAAMSSAKMNRELAVDAKMRDEAKVMEEIVSIFLEADQDQSGTISWFEFQEFMMDERIKAYMMSLELDFKSLSDIFVLLDESHTGDLDLIEFVKGCVRLRGSAKKVDFHLLRKDIAALADRFKEMEQHVLESGKALLS